MAYDKNIIKARTNQIGILSILQDKQSHTFNDLKATARLHQSTLSKWLKHFEELKCIKKVGSHKRQEYQITSIGILTYRKLLTEEKAQENLTKMKLMDSADINKMEIVTSQGKFKVVGNILSSDVFSDEERQTIERGFTKAALAEILKPVGDKSASFAITLQFIKKADGIKIKKS